MNLAQINSRFRRAILASETDITSDDFTCTILPTAISAFAEGEPHFFVTVDINDKAATDDAIDISIKSVTFSNQTSYADFTNPASTAKVLNTIASVCDEHTYTILGKWQFTHTAAKASDFPTVAGGYTMEICDQVSTFMPATSGKKLKMEFSLFDIFYDNDIYGYDHNKAQFVIYNGKDTNGDILFEVKDATSATTLPPTITSTSEDGALTVLFNANPAYSGYTNAAGWKAVVSETRGTSTALPSASVDNEVVKYFTPNGQLVIMREGILYNAAGTRIR